MGMLAMPTACERRMLRLSGLGAIPALIRHRLRQSRIVAIDGCIYPGGSDRSPMGSRLVTLFVVSTPATYGAVRFDSTRKHRRLVMPGSGKSVAIAVHFPLPVAETPAITPSA
jgi:hypothetical protein